MSAEQPDELQPGRTGEPALEEAPTGDEEKERLQLTVDVASPSACQRHVTVSVDRSDIERYFNDAFSEMMPTAAVPGFRPGRAPRKLVENRFRKEVSEKVKSSLLMDSLSQVSDEQKLAAISEPDLDLEAVDLPDDGPLTFEFDLEVRPEFDVPDWKGLSVARPVREFDDRDVDRRLEKILARYGTLVPYEGKAEPGDYLSLNICATHEGEELASTEEEVVRLASVLSLRDGNVEGFDKLMHQVAAGDVREAEVQLTAEAPNKELRGKRVQLRLEVLEVKKLEAPKLTPEFLQEMGDFNSEEELRSAIRNDLERQLGYHQAQQIRRQITSALTASAEWELPPGLLERQSARELDRTTLELRRNGFSDAEIRARENELRQNIAASTATALKEHFILERIAEEENIEADNQDYDAEVRLIAAQSGESPRRVRARVEKEGLTDALRNQIIERKVVELVRTHARFQDKPFQPDDRDVEAVDFSAGGGDAKPVMPEATESESQPQSDAEG